MSDSLPKLELSETDDLGNYYSLLGVALLLEANCQTSGSIRNSVKLIEQFMDKESLHISLSVDGCPLGYVAFDSDTSSVLINRLVAPFGDHLAVIREFCLRVPAGCTIHSLNNDASRKLQRVC